MSQKELSIINISEISAKKNPSFSGNDLDVFVHPYYKRPAHRFPLAGEFKSPTGYREERDKELQRIAGRRHPVVVFEESGNVKKLADNLLKSGFRGEAFVIPTFRDEPEPSGVSWETIMKIFGKSDVSGVKISGTLLEGIDKNGQYNVFMPGRTIQSAPQAFETIQKYMSGIGRENPKAQAWVNSGIVPGGCVGLAAVNFLSRGVDVVFSKATAPYTI